MFRQCPACRRKVRREVKQYPFYCPCGRKVFTIGEFDEIPFEEWIGMSSPVNWNVYVCRSNRCGRYLAGEDKCEILVDKGKPGRVTFLHKHPHISCVADPPLFVGRPKNQKG